MVLAYHQIVTRECAYRYSLKSALFDEHMAFLSAMKEPPAVTFDDGHISQQLNAAPSLDRHGIAGTFFVTASWVGRENYMSWAALRELRARGHAVQSHGWAHKMLPQCSQPQMMDELRRSKATLEDHLAFPVTEISCPGGAWNAAVLDACSEAGYRSVYTSEPWAGVQHDRGLRIVGRLMVRRNCRAGDLRTLMRAERCPLSAVRLQFACANALRKAMGLKLYHALWCRLSRWSPGIEAEQ